MVLLIRHCLYALFLLPFFAHAEDGSDLWLRYTPIEADVAKQRSIDLQDNHDIGRLAKRELDTYWAGQSVLLRIDKKARRLKEGYVLKGDASRIELVAAEPVGLLYGAYHLLRLQETGGNINHLDIEEMPDYDIRILNHWDNLDRTEERGYAGYSLWRWDELPHKLSPRYEQYARANASIGINATVLNNEI